MKKQNLKQIIGAGHIGSQLKDIEEVSTIPIGCIHKSYCSNNIHKYSIKCVFGQTGCNIKKFYDKYKDFDYGRQLGI